MLLNQQHELSAQKDLNAPNHYDEHNVPNELNDLNEHNEPNDLNRLNGSTQFNPEVLRQSQHKRPLFGL